MPPISDHDALKALLLENQKILMENNSYLKKLHRHLLWGFWLRLLVWAFILGLPLLLYYAILQPYVAIITGDTPDFQESSLQLNNWKTWLEAWHASENL